MPPTHNVHSLFSDVVKPYPDEVPKSRANQDLFSLVKQIIRPVERGGVVMENLTLPNGATIYCSHFQVARYCHVMAVHAIASNGGRGFDSDLMTSWWR